MAVMVFKSTIDAIKVQKLLGNSDIQVEVMPVPRSLSASCGIALRVRDFELETIKSLIKSAYPHIQINILETDLPK